MLEKLFGKNELIVIVRGDCNDFARGRIAGIIQGALGFAIDESEKRITHMTVKCESYDAVYYTVTGGRVTKAQRDKIKKLIGNQYPKNIDIFLW